MKQQSKINSFFTPVDVKVHKDNSVIDLIHLERRLNKEAKLAALKQQARDEAFKEKRNIRVREHRAKAKEDSIRQQLEEEAAEEIIDADADLGRQVRMDFLAEPLITGNKKKKLWSKRPEYWTEIVDLYMNHNGQRNYNSVLELYAEEFEGVTPEQGKARLNEWVRNVQNNKDCTYVTRAPDYGWETDKKLHKGVLDRMKLGLSLDNFILRTLLVSLLISSNQIGLLKENGGRNTFESSWATRFWKWRLDS